MKTKLLVTGFQPFLGEKINPSSLLLSEIKKKVPQVETLTLPVSYKRSYSILKDYWDANGPFESILMLGQAGGRKALGLERVALNWCETDHPDEDGESPPLGRLVTDGPSAYFCDFFPKSWKDELAQIGPVEISHSAGAFVCNSLYYRAIHSMGKNTKILFTHVPYLPEQTTEKGSHIPSLNLATQLEIVLELIRLLKK